MEIDFSITLKILLKKENPFLEGISFVAVPDKLLSATTVVPKG